MFKNNKLRLLMSLVGCQRTGADDDVDAAWRIPSSITANELQQDIESIRKYQVNSPLLEDGQTADDFIQRKSSAQSRRITREGITDGNETSEGEEDFDFPAGGPTIRRSSALEELKNKRRRKRKEVDEALSDTEREVIRDARREANAKKQKKIKSDLLVHDSDDEDNEERDREFFAKEEERRNIQQKKVMELLGQGESRDTEMTLDDSDGDLDMRRIGEKKRTSVGRADMIRKRQKRSFETSREEDSILSSTADDLSSDNLLSEEEELTDTPISSPRLHPTKIVGSKEGASASSLGIPVRTITSGDLVGHSGSIDRADGDDGGDDEPVALRKRRTRGGFVIESDSES